MNYVNRAKNLRPTIYTTAKKYGGSPELLEALVYAESRFDQSAISPDGAVGVAQILPENGAYDDYKRLTGNYADIYTEQGNLEVASWYLFKRIPQMLRHYGKAVTTKNKLWAYNAGIGNLNKGIFPQETDGYIRTIRSYKDGFRLATSAILLSLIGYKTLTD